MHTKHLTTQDLEKNIFEFLGAEGWHLKESCRQSMIFSQTGVDRAKLYVALAGKTIK